MGDIRVSASQPQGPAFTSEGISPEAPQAATTATKTAKATATKAKATKATKAKAKSPTAKVNASGKAFRCTVKLGATQCANPARWPHGKGWTCTTHHKAIGLGAKVQMVSLKSLYQAPTAKSA